MIRPSILIASLFLSGTASAGPILDFIRDYDLNDYALGIAVSSSQNPFAGGENSRIAYPYLTSFTDSAMTDDWLYFRGGGMGVRWVTESNWELGVLGRVQTLGFGNSDSIDLVGIADRQWGLEIGPAIGWRGWPVHINFDLYKEVTGNHDGLVGELAFSLPINYSRGYIVPSIDVVFQDSKYNDYYFSVTDAESRLDRPAYSPGSSENLAVRVRWGYELSEKWLLAGSFGLEMLDSSISDSPIVERDRVMSGHVGLAYNVDVFQARDYEPLEESYPRLDVRIGAFYDSIDTKVARDTVDGVPGFETDIEEFLGAADHKTLMQLDANVQVAHFHRVEFGYFSLARNASTTLQQDLDFGDVLFPEGAEVDTRFDAHFFRAVYAYSLMRDAQKELSVMLGVHNVDLEVDITSTSDSQVESLSAGTPLPVIGLSGAVFLNKTTIGAKVQIFRTDFDQYEGSLNYATLDVQYALTDAVSVGLGYNYYGMKLTSKDTSVNGFLKILHHGPVAFLNLGF